MGGKPKESRATIKRLLEYMGKDKMLVVLALVFVLVFSGATLAGSYMLKPIVDQLGKTALQVASLKNKNLDFSTVLAVGYLRRRSACKLFAAAYHDWCFPACADSYP